MLVLKDIVTFGSLVRVGLELIRDPRQVVQYKLVLLAK